MNGDKVVTAHFVMCQYTLTVNIDGSGSVTKNPDQPTYTYGTSVVLTAIPSIGWEFSYWTGDLSGSDNPETIVMNGDKVVTAHFVMCQYTLTVNIDGSGSVIKSPDQPTYTYGTPVELTAIPESRGWVFDHWSGDLSGSDNPETIVMNGDKVVTAHFVYYAEYTLTINIEGECGWVIKSPDLPTYHEGAIVMLTAESIACFYFSYWSGDLSGSNNPEYIVMDSDKTVTAHFLVNYYTIDITIDGNGYVEKIPDNPTHHCGSNVTLTAIPDPGWDFSYWSGDLSGSNNPEYIIMNSDKTVTAHFTSGEYKININIEGNGVVIKNPNHNTFPYGEEVELTAISDNGWKFDHWSGDLAGENNPEIIFIDGNKDLTAHFVIANPPDKPNIEGSIKIKAGEEYEYKFSSIDPYGGNVYFYIDWGDGTFEQWLGPYASGEKATFSHTWTENGKYILKVKARNIYYAESGWATLDLKMSKSKIVISSLLQNLLKDHPQLFRILRQVLSGYII
jgi:hypothetical protein